ncbi:MAG TPA: ribonuclease H-like domain-containing protein [Bryobacteraceae bacterium]|nr:ribonuclease H-like domain-containing protein [Bryobacteraceae bacterium]
MANVSVLTELRARVAAIDRKFAERLPPAPPPPRVEAPEQYFVQEWLHGDEVETPFGRHFETERLYQRHRRYGSMDISSLAEVPANVLGLIAGEPMEDAPPEKWAFLDTETTGLSGTAGTYAFLVGVGRITPEGFRVRQFFMREPREEMSLLWRLAEHLAEFDVLITYNGKAYDEPLLETRYRIFRMPAPFVRLAHVDVLFAARRLWKLRFESCRLVRLENQILGIERQGDLPGELIPYVYVEYLRTREAFQLMPIFHHNSMDIVTLACLTAIVPGAFQGDLRNGAEMVAVARWLRREGEWERARDLFRRAVDRGLADHLLFRTLWDIAGLEKKLGRHAAAFEVLRELAESRNPFRAAAWIEVAKYYEHREKNYSEALAAAVAALALSDGAGIRRRLARLERRLMRKSAQAKRPAPMI